MNNPDDTATELLDYFQKAKPDCLVLKDWKNGFSYCRFYFDRNNDYAYILDISRGVIEAGFDHAKNWLEEAKWQGVLEANAGKRIPAFKDGAFTATMRPWPKKHTHRRP